MKKSIKPYLRLTAILGVTAVVCVLMDKRIARAGDWLPPVSTNIGTWQSKEIPLTSDTLAQLGHPRYMQREYVDANGQKVIASVIAANSLDAYHEPAICAAGSGFKLVDENTIPIAGPGTYSDVRVMAFRNGPERVVMSYWTQNRDGSVDAGEAFMSRQGIARLGMDRPSFAALFGGRQTCIVRVYTIVDSKDKTGQQACNSVFQVSRAIYKSLRQPA